MDKVNAERVPDWYGAVVLYFPTTVPIERLEAALSGPLKVNTYYDIAGTMEITYDEFLHSDRDKKRELVKQTICSSFKKIIKSYRRKVPGLEAVASKVIDSFQ